MKMNKLIVYFSYTNHTKEIANRIKEKINCDILEIKTVIPYSEDYNKVVDDEQNSEASNHLPKIQDINVDLSKYDEIILGTPVWWYRPAPAIRTFLSQNDLSGKGKRQNEREEKKEKKSNTGLWSFIWNNNCNVRIHCCYPFMYTCDILGKAVVY